ncbi:MAG: HAD hydrolase-like protein [Patescibacteria group bacterium]
MKRVLVFDFDGVLVNSNRLKQRAFFNLFSSDTKTAPIIKKILHEAPVNWTRFEILKEIFVKLGCAFYSIQKLVDEYELKYRTAVRDEILAQGTISGVCELLEERQRNGRRLYINSATPCLALAELVVGLDIRKYFERIYGKPPTKAENLADIMRRENATANDCAFIGDGKEDRSSAEAFGVFFVGIGNEWNGWTNAEQFPVVKNVFEAIARIEREEA